VVIAIANAMLYTSIRIVIGCWYCPVLLEANNMGTGYWVPFLVSFS